MPKRWYIDPQSKYLAPDSAKMKCVVENLAAFVD
jgi:hypothetical protein